MNGMMSGRDGGGIPPTDEWDDADRAMVAIAVACIPAALFILAVLRVVVEPMIGRCLLGGER